MTLRRNRLDRSLSCVLAAWHSPGSRRTSRAARSGCRRRPARLPARTHRRTSGRARSRRPNGNTVSLYTPQLDSWDGRTIDWHAAVSIQAPGAKEPTFGVMFAPPRPTSTRRRAWSADGPPGHEGELSVGGGAPNDTYLEDVPAGDREEERPSPSRSTASRRTSRSSSSRRRASRSPSRTTRRRSSSRASPRSSSSSTASPSGGRSREDRPRARHQHEPDPAQGQDREPCTCTSSTDGSQSRRSQGPWTVAKNPPASLSAAYKKILDAKSGDPLTGGVPDDPDAKDVEQPTLSEGRPGRLRRDVADRAHRDRRAPNYVPIDGTQLLYVKNTTGRVFKNDRGPEDLRPALGPVVQRARDPRDPGPTWRSTRLPKDFAAIPDESPMENVKASVPGTQQAQEAVVSNSIPQTAAVKSLGDEAAAGQGGRRAADEADRGHLAPVRRQRLLADHHGDAERVLPLPERRLVRRRVGGGSVDGGDVGAGRDLFDPAVVARSTTSPTCASTTRRRRSCTSATRPATRARSSTTASSCTAPATTTRRGSARSGTGRP